MLGQLAGVLCARLKAKYGIGGTRHLLPGWQLSLVFTCLCIFAAQWQTFSKVRNGNRLKMATIMKMSFSGLFDF